LEHKRLSGARVPIAGPWITAKEIEYVTDAVANSWYENATNYTDRFEKAFAAYLGVKHAVALPSCTAAIHLALAGLGIGPGDEVIVPESTWIASAAPATYLGATPVFADVDEQTWCLSAESVARCLTPRTRAVVAVDLYGAVPDYEALRAVCEPDGIVIIEDAAEAMGSEYRGKPAGSLGDVGVFSFHGSKTLTTGEGGLLATNRDDLRQRVKSLQNHGQSPNDPVFFNGELGFKYQMCSMQAALGLAQLERADELVARKREIFSWYARELDGLDGVTLNQEPPGTKNGYWIVTIVVDERYDLPKVQLMSLLKAEGIDTRPFFYPLSSIPAFRFLGGQDKWRARNPIAYKLSEQAINLPSAFSIDEETVHRVCSALRTHLRNARVSPLRLAASSG
jgi:perosamine synthetase